MKIKSKSKKTINKHMKQKNLLPEISLDISEIESQCPKKHKRSHHVLLSAKNIVKNFGQGQAKTHVLKNISLSIYSGEFVIISGASGSGKSTLLHTLLGLEPPTIGQVVMRGANIYDDFDESGRANWRRQKIGMVFQHSNWIKSLSVLDNVSYPLWLSGLQKKEANERSMEVLESVGMADWAKFNPNELSGGQQQRVSLARALVGDPGIIIADEPTGNLDSNTSKDIMILLTKLNRVERRMVLMVTHDLSFLPLANRRIVMQDGSIIHDEHD